MVRQSSGEVESCPGVNLISNDLRRIAVLFQEAGYEFKNDYVIFNLGDFNKKY